MSLRRKHRAYLRTIHQLENFHDISASIPRTFYAPWSDHIVICRDILRLRCVGVVIESTFLRYSSPNSTRTLLYRDVFHGNFINFSDRLWHYMSGDGHGCVHRGAGRAQFKSWNSGRRIHHFSRRLVNFFTHSLKHNKDIY